MPRKRIISPSSIEDFDDDFDDDNSSNGSKSNLPVQRNAANARERARMRVLSSAFCRLKTKLPWVPADTKLSKLDTLRLATIYIQQLRTSLATGKDSYKSPYDNSRIESSPSSAGSQTSLVWPFSFQQQQQQQQNHQHLQQHQFHENGQFASLHQPNHSEQSIQNADYWYDRHFTPNTRVECKASAVRLDTEPHHKYFEQTRNLINNNTINSSVHTE